MIVPCKACSGLGWVLVEQEDGDKVPEDCIECDVSGLTDENELPTCIHCGGELLFDSADEDNTCAGCALEEEETWRN